MSIKVEVRSEELDVKTGVSQKNGKPYNIREQSAWGFFV
ncbi:MAG: G5P family DNA-binding protein, partial [Zoogloeaceae bacterium]|nr:G5P family DNA-binding protein [Zoogloeaceae bacterium]